MFISYIRKKLYIVYPNFFIFLGIYELQQTFLNTNDNDDELIKQLPKEILLRIFSYLDVVSLCRCAQVRSDVASLYNKYINTC